MVLAVMTIVACSPEYLPLHTVDATTWKDGCRVNAGAAFTEGLPQPVLEQPQPTAAAADAKGRRFKNQLPLLSRLKMTRINH